MTHPATSIAILSPGFPDSAGGVTAHTHRLVRNWSDSGHDVTVIGNLSEGAKSAMERLREAGAKFLLVQYVPFLYGRRGLSRFPERLVRGASRAGIRVTIFVHEPWVPATRLPWVVLSPLQRRQLKGMLAIAHAVVTPVPRWKAQLRDDTEIVYVGNTMGDSEAATAVEPPLPAPVVFSPFAGGLRWEWIVEASKAIGAQPSLTVIGADADQVRLHHSVGKWFQVDWECMGHLPAAEVLARLARARLVLAPFADGVTGRRTSLFAAASVGARILCSTGHLHDESFTSSALHVATSREDFIDKAVRLWSTAAGVGERSECVAWYKEVLDPVRLDARLLEVVLSPYPTPPPVGGRK